MAVEQNQQNNFDTFEKSSNNDDSNITDSNSNSHNENIFIVKIYFIFIN
jgi:hypothetical protein